MVAINLTYGILFQGKKGNQEKSIRENSAFQHEDYYDKSY